MAYYIQITNNEYNTPLYYKHWENFTVNFLERKPFETLEDCQTYITSQEDIVAYQDRQMYFWEDVEIKSD